MSYIRNVVIFGATGNTGLCCTEAAVDLGYQVTAFVRDPDKLPYDLASRVSVKVGDILDAYQVEDAVQGQDAVVIVIGTRNDLSPTTMMSEGTKNVLRAMEMYNVQRVSACLSSFNLWEKSKVPERFHNILDDHERMHEALKNSDREWVAVLPPHITSEPGRGDFVMEHGRTPGRTISKYDLAQFMVTCFTDDRNLYQMCGLCDRS